MNDQGSILDKIISSKKTQEIEQFNPNEVVSNLIKVLTSREEDVLRRRYGLLGKRVETLEEIGASYQVTRERIRQIENTAINKIKKQKNFNDILNIVDSTVFSVLEQNGGIISEDSLLNRLLHIIGDSEINRKNIIFIISELLGNKYKSIKPDREFRKSWQLIHAPVFLLKDTIDELYKIITAGNRPIKIHEILEEFKKSEIYIKNSQTLSEEAIISYLEVSQRISRNPFDEFGLTEWGSIIPKRMNDKIYLVLKQYGKPMHFTQITEKINETKFDGRKAYPPTVHNELILNNQYVLVGRGIYALKEWGYKPGVVANVITEILKNEQKPISREELVNKVLQQRLVKKNTIHLALTDKTKFKKNSEGLFTLVENT